MPALYIAAACACLLCLPVGMAGASEGAFAELGGRKRAAAYLAALPRACGRARYAALYLRTLPACLLPLRALSAMRCHTHRLPLSKKNCCCYCHASCGALRVPYHYLRACALPVYPAHSILRSTTPIVKRQAADVNAQQSVCDNMTHGHGLTVNATLLRYLP